MMKMHHAGRCGMFTIITMLTLAALSACSTQPSADRGDLLICPDMLGQAQLYDAYLIIEKQALTDAVRRRTAFCQAYRGDDADDPFRKRDIGGFPPHRTDVQATILGQMVAVDVKQHFSNPHDFAVDLLYWLALPDDAAVTDFVITLADRRIRGIIRPRDEALAIHRQAQQRGLTTTFMSRHGWQHDTNGFYQEIKHLPPHAKMEISINYFHTLAYDEGWHVFQFPAFNQDAGYLFNQHLDMQVNISIQLEAAVPVAEMRSTHDAVAITRHDDQRYDIALHQINALHARDFQLAFRPAGDMIHAAMLTHEDEHGSYFALMLHDSAEKTLRDVKLDFGRDAALMDVYANVGRTGNGRARMYVGRFTGKLPAVVQLHGRLDDQPMRLSVATLRPTDSFQRSIVARLWARHHIIAMAKGYEQQAGYETIDAAIRQTALDFGLLSSRTAFVTVDAAQPQGAAKP